MQFIHCVKSREGQIERLGEYELPHIRALSTLDEAVTPSEVAESDAVARSAKRIIIRWIPQWLFELMAYGIVSVLALVTDTLILRCLVMDADWNYIPASILSFVSGAVVAYLLSVRFVFRGHKTTNHALEFGYFLMLGLAGLVVNTIVLWLAVGIARRNLIASKLLASACTFITNFVLRRSLLFSPPAKRTMR